SPGLTLFPYTTLFRSLRLGPGAELEIFDGRGARWPARIESPGVLRLGRRADPDRGAADVWLAQALAKGEKLDLVVQKATELGARSEEHTSELQSPDQL